MVSTILILALAASALILCWKLVRAARQDRYKQEGLHELNVCVFRALTNSSDDIYLRTRLDAVRTRSFHRKRTALALQMIRLVDENAQVVIHMAQRAKAVGDPVLTSKAEELMGLALRLRMNLVAVRFCLGIKWLMPGLDVVVPAWDTRYRDLAASLFRLRQDDPRFLFTTN